jgi:hypothetical protein
VSETSSANGERRHSIAFEPDLIKDPVKLAEAEAANGLRQLARVSRKTRLIGKRPMVVNLDFAHRSSLHFTVRRSPGLAHSPAFIGQLGFRFTRANTFRLELTAFQSWWKTCATT